MYLTIFFLLSVFVYSMCEIVCVCLCVFNERRIYYALRFTVLSFFHFAYLP